MKTLVTSVIFVLAVGSLYDNVIESCLYAGFSLGGSEKMQTMASFLFLLLEQRVE